MPDALDDLNELYETARAGAAETIAAAMLAPIRRRIREEILRLRAIIEKLPNTADGVSVVPGVDYVWAWWPREGRWVAIGIVGTTAQAPHACGSWCRSVSACDSTREAAEAARGKENDGA